MVPAFDDRADGRVSALSATREAVFRKGYRDGQCWMRLACPSGLPTRQDIRNYAVPALRACSAAQVLTLLPAYIQGFEAGCDDEYTLHD